jgi:hypothetical protein
MLSLFVMCFFLFIAVVRYHFAELSPALAVEATISSIPDAVIATDPAGNVVFCNYSSNLLFRDGLINRNLFLFSPGGELQGRIAAFFGGSADSQKFEAVFRKGNGDLFASEATCSRLQAEGDILLGILWNIRDRSADLEIKNTLMMKREETQKKINEIGKMNVFMEGREARLEELRGELAYLQKT